MAHFGSLGDIMKKFEKDESFLYRKKKTVSTIDSKPKSKLGSRSISFNSLFKSGLKVKLPGKKKVVEGKLIDFDEEVDVIDNGFKFNENETDLICFNSSESECSDEEEDYEDIENYSLCSEESEWSEEENVVYANERDLVTLVDELINCEEEYVMELKKMVTYFIETDPTFKILPWQIFRNTHEIYMFHCKDFLQALKSANYDLSKITEIFIHNRSKFWLYNFFSLIDEEKFTIVNAHEHFFLRFININNTKQNIKTYHLNPFHRLTEYCASMVKLINYCSESEMYSNSGVVKNNLRSIRIFLEFLIAKINFNLSLELINDLQVNLTVQGELLKHDLFYVIDGNGKEFSMRCFLFEKLMLFTLVYQDSDKGLLYYDAIKTKDMSLTVPAEDKPVSFNVTSNTLLTKYTLITLYTIQLEWAHAIQKCRMKI